MSEQGSDGGEGHWLLFVLALPLALGIWGLVRPGDGGGLVPLIAGEERSIGAMTGGERSAVVVAGREQLGAVGMEVRDIPTVPVFVPTAQPATAPPFIDSTRLSAVDAMEQPSSALSPVEPTQPAVDSIVGGSSQSGGEIHLSTAKNTATGNAPILSPACPWPTLGWVLLGVVPIGGLTAAGLVIYRHVTLTQARAAAIRMRGVYFPPESSADLPQDDVEKKGPDSVPWRVYDEDGREVDLWNYLAGEA